MMLQNRYSILVYTREKGKISGLDSVAVRSMLAILVSHIYNKDCHIAYDNVSNFLLQLHVMLTAAIKDGAYSEGNCF